MLLEKKVESSPCVSISLAEEIHCTMMHELFRLSYRVSWEDRMGQGGMVWNRIKQNRSEQNGMECLKGPSEITESDCLTTLGLAQSKYVFEGIVKILLEH